MKRKAALSNNNASDATETDASQLSKKRRLGDTPQPSGAADQKPPPADGNDVDTTTSDEAPPMEVEEEETEPVAEEVPEEATEEEKRAAEGWLSPKSDVDDAVAAAKAAAAAQSDGELTKLRAALAKCGEEGAPGSLEKIPMKDLTLKKITDIIDIKGVVGATYSALYNKGEKTSKKKAHGRVRPKLKELLKGATENKTVALEKAEVETRLRFELAAVEALPDDEPDVTTLRSLLACGSLLENASSGCLTVCGDGESGTVDRLVVATRKAGVEVVGWVDGVALENTNKNNVLRVAYSLERALNALPPQEVVKAVIDRLKLLKYAPRVDKAGCAELATTIRDAATGFAARGPKSAAKVTVDLPSFPTRDPATLTRRREEYEKWTGAPAAQQAAVWSGVSLDSYALGTAAPLQKWPKYGGRPTIVGGVELATIKPMDVLAKKLAHGEKCEKGRAGEEESG